MKDFALRSERRMDVFMNVVMRATCCFRNIAYQLMNCDKGCAGLSLYDY